MFLDLKYEEIYPYICVYKNLFFEIERCHGVLKMSLKKSQENPDKKIGLFPNWTDWYSFGKVVSIMGDALAEPKSEEGIFEQFFLYEDELMLAKQIQATRIAAISHYIGKYSIPVLKEPHIQIAINIGMYYEETLGCAPGLTMNYHTDYNVEKIEQECINSILTCNMYFNDDYEGGEISFYAYGEKFDYKPKAGDIIVFPSGSPLFPGNEPYFHAVKTIKNGNKFIARNYLMYKQDASDDWIRNETLYGKEEWQQMEKIRIENDIIPSNMLDINNGVINYNKKIDQFYWGNNTNV